MVKDQGYAPTHLVGMTVDQISSKLGATENQLVKA
jgi:hypothetical protein